MCTRSVHSATRLWSFRRPIDAGLPVPNGVVLDGHDSRRQQLELLLYLEAVASTGHLDAPVKHGCIRLALQRPAQDECTVSPHASEAMRSAATLCLKSPARNRSMKLGLHPLTLRLYCAHLVQTLLKEP